MVEKISSTQIIPITSSPACVSVTPLTPAAFLPIGRTFASLKRMARPELVAITISLTPLVNLASNNSSLSRIVIALIPLERGREYASKDVFLITPNLEHMIIKLLLVYSLSVKSKTLTYAFTLSSCGILIRF